jgi:3-phenylpropionate/trans-cinnamate dioxygenase ferredoxin component
MSDAEPAEDPRPDRDVVEDVNRLITALQEHPDPEVGAQVRELLQGIDAVHRTGLTRLLTAIQGMAGEAFINRLVGDPAIRFLLMSYELLAVDRRIMAEEVLDAVRGPLHQEGVDVEIVEVVGGVVYVRLHGAERCALPVASMVERLEGALREEFIGFQELVVRDRGRATTGSLIPPDALRRTRRPVYRAALPLSELPPGTMKAIEVAGHPVLFANTGGDVFAVANRCGESPLPLEFGTLSGAELLCSWHGCRYDIRTGKRTDRDGDRLHVFPVAVADGEIRIAVDTVSAAPLPLRTSGASR